MKKLLIVGAGNFGREVCAWMHTDNRYGVDWEVAGFLDDDPDALAQYKHYQTGVVGSIREYTPRRDEQLVMAISSPGTKMMVAAMLESRGAQFVTWIHSGAVVSPLATIGRGTVVCPQCVISPDTSIGSFVTVNCTSSVGHDARIGNGCTINGHCDLTGYVQLGEGVFLGSSVCVVPRVKIGDRASIGAGSVVVRRVKADTTVMGPAARRIDVSGGVSQKEAA